MKAKTSFRPPVFRLELRISKEVSKEIKEKEKEIPFNEKTGAILNNIPILVDFRINDTRILLPIGYRIDYDKWNNTEQRVKRNNFNKNLVSFSEINRHIDLISNKIESLFIECTKSNTEPTKELFIPELQQIINPEKVKKQIEEKTKSNTLNHYFIKFIEAKNQNWQPSTLKKFQTLNHHLYNYKPDLQFSDITEQFLELYTKHQTEVLKLNNVTNKRYLGMINEFLNWATRQKFNTNISYKDYKCNLKGTKTSDLQKNIIFLNWDELMQFYNFDFSDNKRLEKIKDIFCFCSFTSLRYSDVKNLKKHDIKANKSGELSINITTIKTDNKLQIELNKYSQSIYEKYKPTEGLFLFDVPSNQKYNSYIKEAAKIVGFNSKETIIDFVGNKRTEQIFEKWELISTHTARKTFIINSLHLGILPEVVMKWTGHSDYKTMQHYIKISESEKCKAMKLFDEK